MIGTVLKWIIICVAVINFGFMAYDGIRALAIGDYVRPTEGEFAGQLGPWSHIVETIGIDPESNLMKGIFVLWGIAGLTAAFGFALDRSWSWKAMLMMSIASLWYLVPGTVLSALQLVLLLVPQVRRLNKV